MDKTHSPLNYLHAIWHSEHDTHHDSNITLIRLHTDIGVWFLIFFYLFCFPPPVAILKKKSLTQKNKENKALLVQTIVQTSRNNGILNIKNIVKPSLSYVSVEMDI